MGSELLGWLTAGLQLKVNSPLELKRRLPNNEFLGAYDWYISILGDTAGVAGAAASMLGKLVRIETPVIKKEGTVKDDHFGEIVSR